MAAPSLKYPYEKIMEDPPLIGVIGGSGLYKLDNLTVVKSIEVMTPWGAPSSPITIASLPAAEGSSKPILIAFISRHSPNHSIPPSSVPARANIAALKHLGVKAVLAFSAVGSLREEVRPGDLVVPSQLIDRTKGIRPSTFFDGDHVAHAMFGDPFDTTLTSFILPQITSALALFESAEGTTEEEKPRLHSDRTLIVMEGPQFSTRAESNVYRQWGADIINMSTIPEAKLAREAELSYALVCTSTDYDAWRVGHAPVTVNEVMKTLHTNALLSKHITATILSAVHAALVAGKLEGAERGMKFSMVTGRENTTVEERQKLEYILPAYFAEGAKH